MKTLRIAFGISLAAILLLGFTSMKIAGNERAAPLNAPALQSDATPTPDMSGTLPPLPPLAAPPIVPAAVNAPATPVITSVQTIDDPAHAVPIDNQPHKIAANAATWFSFNYTPADANNNRLTNTITLINGFNSGVRFEVWTSDHMLDWWDGKKPVGQGTANNVACDATQTTTQACQSTDLTWGGSFNMGGNYFVRVVNSNNSPVIFQLTIQ